MGLLGPVENRAAASGGDAIDQTLIAGGHEKVVRPVECQRPDVLGRGIEKQLGPGALAKPVDLAIGRRGGVDLILAIHRQRVDLQGIQTGEHAALSVRRDHVDTGGGSARPAAARVHVPLGVLGQSPEVGQRGIENLGQHRRQAQTPVAAQGELVERALFKVGGLGTAPGAGLDGACPGRTVRLAEEGSVRV